MLQYTLDTFLACFAVVSGDVHVSERLGVSPPRYPFRAPLVAGVQAAHSAKDRDSWWNCGPPPRPNAIRMVDREHIANR